MAFLCTYTSKIRITKEIIESLPNLKLIGVLATSYNVFVTGAQEKISCLQTPHLSYY